MTYTMTVFNGLTNEYDVREMTNEEIKQFEESRIAAQKDIEKSEKLIEDKRLARQAVLSKLGLTDEEIEILLS